MWGRGPRGNSAACSAHCQFSVTSPATHNQIGLLLGCFPGWVGLCTFDDPVGLSNKISYEAGVSPVATSTPTGVFSLRLWGFISLHWNPGLCGNLTPQLFLPVYLHTNVGLPCLPAAALPGLPATAFPTPVPQPLPCRESSPPGCPSPSLLPVWMNVSSLTLWLSDFHTVRFAGSSGCFCF